MKSKTHTAVFLIILISAPLSIVITILLTRFWSWLEAMTGIELIGHSGPAAWCYLIVFLLIAVILLIAFFIYRRLDKNKGNMDF